MTFKKLDDLGDVTGKVALVRVDLNLPMQDGAVTDDTRVRAAAPTILELSAKGAKVLLLAHFGRPKGERVSTMSLSMVVDCLQQVLGKEVMFVPEIAGPVVAQSVGILRPGDIAVLENTRFWKGEEKNDPELVKAIAANGDFYVNDAFSALSRISSAVPVRSCSHRLLPTSTPRAARKVLAMPPPMIRWSTLLTRCLSTSSLEETLAPPTTAATGFTGWPSAFSSASSSACIERPA